MFWHWWLTLPTSLYVTNNDFSFKLYFADKNDIVLAKYKHKYKADTILTFKRTFFELRFSFKVNVELFVMFIIGLEF